MSSVIQSSDPLPSVVLDELLKHLTIDAQSDNPNATNLAVQVINRNVGYLDRPIERFLRETLVEPVDGQKSMRADNLKGGLLLVVGHSSLSLCHCPHSSLLLSLFLFVPLLSSPAEDATTGLTDRSDHLSILAHLYSRCHESVLGFERYAVDLLEAHDERVREEITDVFCHVFMSPAMGTLRAVQSHEMVRTRRGRTIEAVAPCLGVSPPPSFSSHSLSFLFSSLFLSVWQLLESFLNRFRDTSTRVRFLVVKSVGKLIIAFSSVPPVKERLLSQNRETQGE